MFGLSFLITLSIYKDYFKGRKRLRTVAQKHNCTSVKKSVTKNLVCRSSSFSSRSCCVLYTLGFCDQATSWSSSCDELKNFATNILLKLVSHVLGVVHWKWEIATIEQVQLCIGVRVQLSVGIRYWDSFTYNRLFW